MIWSISLCKLCDFGLKKSVDFDDIGLERGAFFLTFSKPFLVSCSSYVRGLKWDANFWLRSEMWFLTFSVLKFVEKLIACN